jgi:hypothetical protein
VATALGASFATVALHSILDVTLLSELAFPFFGGLAVCVAYVALERDEALGFRASGRSATT